MWTLCTFTTVLGWLYGPKTWTGRQYLHIGRRLCIGLAWISNAVREFSWRGAWEFDERAAWGAMRAAASSP
jgi:hypothetical protein